MMRKSSLIVAFVLILSFCLIAPSSFAAENILDRIERTAKESALQTLREHLVKNHGLLINPYFKFGWDFTSNLFGEPEGDKEDIIWKYTPGVNISYTQEKVKIGLSYEADFVYFTKYEKQNEQDQRFSATGDFVLAKDLSLHLSEELIQQGATAGTRSAEPLNFTDNTVSASVHRKWNRMQGEVGFQHFNREYAGNLFDRFSYMEYRYHALSHLQVKEGLVAKTGLTLGWTDYDEDGGRNSNFYELPVGLKGTLPGSVQYDATVALHLRNQEAGHREDFRTVVGDVSLSKQFPTGTGVQVGFNRRPAESTFDDQPYSDNKMFYANATQILNKQTRARLNLSYTNIDFEEAASVGLTSAKRSDDSFAFGLGVDYAARKWLVFNVDYKLNVRDSNIGDFDYSENRFSMGVTVPV